MLIEDLKLKYPLVYEKAIINQDKEKNKLVYGGNSIAEAFEWFETEEGDSFWDNIENGNFEKAKKMIPSLFTEIGNKFKKGDYVVLLHGSSERIPNTWKDCMPIGGVYKLRENSTVLVFRPEKDFKGSINNGWSGHNINSKLLFRKATKTEIEYYNKLNEPFLSETIYNKNSILKNSNNLKSNKNEQRSKNSTEKERFVKEQTGVRGQVIKSSSKKRPTTITSRLVGNRVSIS